MERLTFTDKEMKEISEDFDCPIKNETDSDDDVVVRFCSNVCDTFQNDCPFKRVGERLKGYEDTNLTPEQIVEIDKLYRKKCEELERLKKYLPAFRIGDTAYLVDFDAGTFDKSVVNGIVSRVDGDTAKFDYDSDLLDFCDTDIGVCVFRSETEAQEALERMVQNG